MPMPLLQQLAQAVLSLHQRSLAWIATQDGEAPPEVVPVHCVHVGNTYCLWTDSLVPISESLSDHNTGILLLSHPDCAQNCHLSWIGCLQAVGQQECIYKQAWAALRQVFSGDPDCVPRCLLQLQPQFGRISRNGENDVPLTAQDLTEILHLPVAA